MNLSYDNEIGGDISTADLLAPATGPVSTAQEIREAVIFALMTDARADPSEIREGDNPRGYFAAPIGSTLWLSQRDNITDSALRRIESAAAEAIGRIPITPVSVTAARSEVNPNAVLLTIQAKDERIQVALQ